MSGPAAAGGRAGLVRQLGFVDAVAIHVGIVLGSGIFVAPDDVAAVAPGAWGLLPWLAGAVVAASGAFVYAECATRLPCTGGFYAFYRAGLGEGPAFVAGWAAFLLTYPASMAAIALIFAQFLRQVLPLPAVPDGLLAAAALLAVGAVNALGVRPSALVQRGLTASKLLAIGAVCVAAVAAAGGTGTPAGASDPARPAGIDWVAALLPAMVAVLWAWDGWSDVTLVAGEIEEPGRDLGRMVVVGTLLLLAVYGSVQLAIAALLPAGAAARTDTAFTDAVAVGLGARSGAIVALLVVASTLGSLHGITLTSSRVGFAMARDGAFFATFGRVHPRRGTPARAVAAIIAVSVALVLASGFRELVFLFSFNVWIFYAATAIVLLRLRRAGVGDPVPWRAPGGAAPVAVVLATATAMTGGLLLREPRRSLSGLGMLLLGIPVFLLWRRLRRPAAVLDSAAR